MAKRKSEDAADASVDEHEVKKLKKKKKLKVKDDNHVDSNDEVDKSESKQDKSNQDSQEEEEPVLERFPNSVPVKKTKKRRVRNTNKDNDDDMNYTDQNPDQRIKLALKYLQKWSKKHDEWKFQTVRQVCLLEYMYDQTKVPDNKFKRLLKYMSGMKGIARERTIKEAGQTLVDNDVGSDDEDAQAKSDEDNTKESEKLKIAKIKVDRATRILQTLS